MKIGFLSSTKMNKLQGHEDSSNVQFILVVYHKTKNYLIKKFLSKALIHIESYHEMIRL